jgi:hypothetical protein
MNALMPGALVVVKPGALVRLYGHAAEHYTEGLRNAIVIQETYHVSEDEDGMGQDGRVSPDYIVLFSDDMRMYLCPASHLLTPDEATSPGRLFGRLSG